MQKYKPKIIVGGPGAWQLEDDTARRGLGVDCVVVGEGEKVVKDLFDNSVKGVQIPEVVHAPVAEEQDIPCIQRRNHRRHHRNCPRMRTRMRFLRAYPSAIQMPIYRAYSQGS